MRVLTALRLGRVSNLPTVWSNILAAAFLSEAHLSPATFLLLLLSISLMYIAGMFLNDAMDAEWDQLHGIARPIPLGDASKEQVYLIGMFLIFSGPLLLYCLDFFAPGNGLMASLSGFSLLLAIVLYNWSHKWFSHSTWLMGTCRFMVYTTVAIAVGQMTHDLVFAGLALLFYIAGVTYIARSEHNNTLYRLWPLALLAAPVIYTGLHITRASVSLLFLAILATWVIWQLRFILTESQRNIPAGVGGLLAAIPLIDACFLAMVNALPQALICVLLFLTVPRLQRWIAAT